MARLSYSARALGDLERLVDFLVDSDPVAASGTVALIMQAVQIVEDHPMIGRPCEADLRELVISRGRSGYLALYDFVESEDVVLILAIRHQREAGYVAP